MKRNRHSPLKRILLVTAFGLVVLLAFEVMWLSVGLASTEMDLRVIQPMQAVEIPTIDNLSPREDFQNVIDNSLFSWDRKPKFTEDKSDEDTGDLESRWQLSGIVHTTSISYALFTNESGTIHLRLEPGMFLEKWKIKTLDAESVVLSGEEGEKTLRLKDVDENAGRTKRPAASSPKKAVEKEKAKTEVKD